MLTQQAAKVLFDRIKNDRDLQEGIASLSKDCELAIFGKSRAVFQGQHGYAVADKKHVSLRSAPDAEVIVKHGCVRYLDAAYLAAYWAVHGPND